MKIDNFKLLKIVDGIEYATVEVTTFWKKKEIVTIFKGRDYWQFWDSGKFTPNYIVERLYEAYNAREVYNKDALK